MPSPTAPVLAAGRLIGARAVVTGAARGIGAAIAGRLHAEGAAIAVPDRLEDQGRASGEALDGVFIAVAAWTARSPLGRLADPQDVAGVACFLASADGAYLTGQAINVTGGMITH
ncbi:SDR family oxidoreductase [uncultured Amnibacterium sp.]|uniref:SDR family oxidoreductase n=1 Tax=uncultured Amnibacterium sp. TaxID=1631851 RepID=UPI0035CB8E73